MQRRGRLAALAVLTGAWLLASGPAAAAHGALQSSEPAGGSSLERAPAAVTLRFTERPDPGLSTVRVLDSSGRVVAGGPARPVAGRLAGLEDTVGGRRRAGGQQPQPRQGRERGEPPTEVHGTVRPSRLR